MPGLAISLIWKIKKNMDYEKKACVRKLTNNCREEFYKNHLPKELSLERKPEILKIVWQLKDVWYFSLSINYEAHKETIKRWETELVYWSTRPTHTHDREGSLISHMLSVRPSIPTFQILQNKTKKTMFATGLVEWIIDDTNLVVFLLSE